MNINPELFIFRVGLSICVCLKLFEKCRWIVLKVGYINNAFKKPINNWNLDLYKNVYVLNVAFLGL